MPFSRVYELWPLMRKLNHAAPELFKKTLSGSNNLKCFPCLPLNVDGTNMTECRGESGPCFLTFRVLKNHSLKMSSALKNSFKSSDSALFEEFSNHPNPKCLCVWQIWIVVVYRDFKAGSYMGSSCAQNSPEMFEILCEIGDRNFWWKNKNTMFKTQKVSDKKKAAGLVVHTYIFSVLFFFFRFRDYDF